MNLYNKIDKLTDYFVAKVAASATHAEALARKVPSYHVIRSKLLHLMGEWVTTDLVANFEQVGRLVWEGERMEQQRLRGQGDIKDLKWRGEDYSELFKSDHEPISRKLAQVIRTWLAERAEQGYHPARLFQLALDMIDDHKLDNSIWYDSNKRVLDVGKLWDELEIKKEYHKKFGVPGTNRHWTPTGH